MIRVTGPGPVAPKEKVAPQTSTERSRKRRGKANKVACQNVAVLDMETDPFDAALQTEVRPFLAVLHSHLGTEVIWEEDQQTFARRVVQAITDLPGKFRVYAHNGGRFDWMFLVHLIRGEVMFKGRGIMRATIGRHELLDSWSIIPVALADYKKQSFDYGNMHSSKRDAFRQEIVDYCIDDCRNLLSLVRGFVQRFGFKMSIGQAALAEIRKTVKFEKLSKTMDGEIRRYFFGGRVECVQGRGIFEGDYRLYDVNGMYAAAMQNHMHPVGSQYVTRPGLPGPDTCFVELTCRNHGALVKRESEGLTSADCIYGRFSTTIHEYETALRLGLIEDVEIHFCVDNAKRSNFRGFIEPLWRERGEHKDALKTLAAQGFQSSPEYLEHKRQNLFVKSILVNGFGKFAENPRNFKETYLTNPRERPDPEWSTEDMLPIFECHTHWIWEKPAEEMRFKNVGTAASITGAARAILMEALHHAVDPIYCDTDSIICRDLPGVDIHASRLGAWDIEEEYSEVIVNGKKTYACQPKAGTPTVERIRAKGISSVTYDEMRRAFTGEVIEKVLSAPTLKRSGTQSYMTRRLQATAPVRATGEKNGDHQFVRSTAGIGS